MSMGELLFIGIVILLVVPPEKLPGLAREIARFFNDIRRTTSGVWEDLKKDVPNPVEELRKQKQEVEDYMKLIGSPTDHNKNNPDFQPVYVKPPTDAAQPTTAEPNTTVATTPPAVATPTTPEVATAKPKDEPDKQ